MEPDSRKQKQVENSQAITDRPDGWLLREWKSGDEQAAEVLVDRYALRLVALVASRLNRRYQASIDPNEVVQSAMGSFFDAAKHSRIEVSGSVSLWRLLATFARRKMARSLERLAAIKRGGGLNRVSLDDAQLPIAIPADENRGDEADEFLATLKAELADDLFAIAEGLLAGQSQREIAESIGIDERTVRRRLTRIREMMTPEPKTHNHQNDAHVANNPSTLPCVSYREFVLGKLIGSGGFGKVYRAAMQSDGRTVAVKFLRKAFWQNEVARQTFLREINIASQIDHPAVIRYIGFGESPHGGPYVISEWIDGQTLQNVVGAGPQDFIHWLQQICKAIEAVHQAGLIHGDLTPSNILVDAQNRITITDFGFSQASSQLASPIPADASMLPGVTVRSGATVLGGTLGFAAPEQIDPAFGSISVRTDIYAIGGLIHWFGLGRPPNAAQAVSQTLATTLSNCDLQASDFGTIPQALHNVLIGTLRKSPADRTMSLAGIMSALSAAAGEIE